MYKQQVKNVESSIHDQEVAINRLRQEIADKNETIKEQKEMHLALEQSIQEARSQNEGKDNVHENLQKTISDHQLSIDELNDIIEQKTIENDELNAKVKSMENDNKE